VDECPEEAIKMVSPSPSLVQEGATLESDTQAKMRAKLGSLVDGLAVTMSENPIAIPEEITTLLVPKWDNAKCIGCRECELDVCPYDVVTETVTMPERKKISGRRTILRMHPETATSLGLRNGDHVNVESRRGRLDGITLELDEDIDPRVVWSSDGWWERNGNVNVLTDDKHTPFGHTPGFNSVLVRVTKGQQPVE
jgi:ferredoxin